MTTPPKTLEQKFNAASKFVVVTFYISFLSSALLALTVTYLETKWEWLSGWQWFFEAISRVLLTYAFSSLVISLMISAPLMLVFPALGYAWLRGGLRHFFSYKPWREVSDGEAFLSLLGAMFSFFVGLLILHELVINGVFGQALASFA